MQGTESKLGILKMHCFNNCQASYLYAKMFRGTSSIVLVISPNLREKGNLCCTCSKSIELLMSWPHLRTASCQDHPEIPVTVQRAQAFCPQKIGLNGGSLTWGEACVHGKEKLFFLLHLRARDSKRVTRGWVAGWTFTELNDIVPSWCCPRGGVCERILWAEFNMVSLKLEDMWGKSNGYLHLI